MLLTQEEGRAPPEETCMALVPRSPGTPPMPVPSELDQGGMSSGDEDSPDAIVQLATEAPKVTKPKASKKRQQLNSQRENSGSSNNPPGDGELGEEDLKRRRKARALPNGALRGGRGARRVFGLIYLWTAHASGDNPMQLECDGHWRQQPVIRHRAHDAINWTWRLV